MICFIPNFISASSRLQLRHRPRLTQPSQSQIQRHGRPPRATLRLPSWEDAETREHGLVTTSYETATVHSITSATNTHIKLTLDTSATCTSTTYISEGQFLYLKPWGDEDGNIEAATFSHAPSQSNLQSFFVSAAGRVAEAAAAGEMLEVSDVMGVGFRPAQNETLYKSASRIIALADGPFCTPVTLALRNEQRPRTLFFAGEEHDLAAFAPGWSVSARCCSMSRLAAQLSDELHVKHTDNVVILLSACASVCHILHDVLDQMHLSNVHVLTP